MTTQSRISRQDKTRQFSLWRFWSSKSIKSQIEGRIFNFSPFHWSLYSEQFELLCVECPMHGWVGGGFTLQQDFPFACRYWFAPTAKKYYIQCKWPQIDHSTASSFNFFVWSVQCMGGWFDFAARFPPLLQILTDLLQLPRNTTLQMTPNCKKITAQRTFARVICKIWDLFLMGDGGYFSSPGIFNFPEN